MKGSKKIAAANGRIRKERSFLDSLSVRHDDPDTVLNDSGKLLPIHKLITVEGVEFVLNNITIPIAVVKASLDVISQCRETIKRLGG